MKLALIFIALTVHSVFCFTFKEELVNTSLLASLHGRELNRALAVLQEDTTLAIGPCTTD